MGLTFSKGYTTINLNNEDEIKKIPPGIRYITKTTGLPTDVSSTNGWLLNWFGQTLNYLQYISNLIILVNYYKE